MSDPRRILVPVRLEAVGEEWLAVLAEQAHALDAQVVLLHVLTRGDLDPAVVGPKEAAARTYLETVAAHLEDRGVQASAVVRGGSPVAAIVGEAATIGAVLVVLGATSRQWWTRMLRGSIAERVARLAPCPVLLVRPDQASQHIGDGLRSFAEDAARAGAFHRRRLGIRTIEVARIVGSVDRARDLGTNFRRRGLVRPGSTEEQRFRWILNATRSGADLPPISVYKLGFGYYVEDGHHRVAAARLNGQTEIEADVTEFVSAGDDQAGALFAARADFERATGLTDIGAARPETYVTLREEIEAFARQQGLADLRLAACRWEGDVYRPLWRQIRARELGATYPGERTADVVARMASWRAQSGRDSWADALAAIA